MNALLLSLLLMLLLILSERLFSQSKFGAIGRMNVLLLLLLSILSKVTHALLFDAMPCERASAAATDLSKIYYRKPVLLLLLLLICQRSIIAVQLIR